METLYQQCVAFYLADWYVEPSLHQLSRREQVVRVEPKVMEVLVCLARYNGKVVSKDVFMDEVWRDTVVSNDVLSRCISELRKVFEDRAAEPQYIETIRKAGYRLIAPVTRIPEYDKEEPSFAAASGELVTYYEEAGPVISRGGAEPSLSRIYRQFRGELLRWFRHRRRALWTWGAAGLIVTALLAFVWQWNVAEPFDPSSPVPLTS